MAIANVFNSSGGARKESSEALTREFTFTNVTTITINHSFTSKPHITIIDTNGNVIEAEKRYINNRQILINFSSSLSGTIILR